MASMCEADLERLYARLEKPLCNVVFRWEYRPGSTLFLVWQRLQDDEASIGDFDFGRDVAALFDAPAVNAFMIKLNYWFAL